MTEQAQLPPVVDDKEHRRFLLRDGDHEAKLIYRERTGELVLVHTEVPDELGGRGIGRRLVEFALDRARSTGETVVPWCPFARHFLRTHPEAAEGIRIDWSDPPPVED